jgi:hypothetical protein
MARLAGLSGLVRCAGDDAINWSSSVNGVEGVELLLNVKWCLARSCEWLKAEAIGVQ